MAKQKLSEVININKPNAHGELEFIFKDRNGKELYRYREPNLVKVFAKEILPHRMHYSKIWNPNAGSGAGAWESSGIDESEEFAAKYILLGASYDENGVPLEFNDTRYYTEDTVSSSFIPVTLNPGAEYDGSLINGIPMIEPDRPLKRVESISYESSYQPSGTPLLQDDVRAMNNVVVLETTLKTNEYNGFGVTDSDYFTLTEVALAGGRIFDTIGACNCTPRKLFLQGTLDGSTDTSERPLVCVANGGSVITIDMAETDVDLIKEGDQIRIGATSDVLDGSSELSDLSQTSPYYLVISKSVGGRDITLDRAVVDSSSNQITGSVGVFRDTLKIFSHRILSTPIRKSNNIELVIRWRIIFN